MSETRHMPDPERDDQESVISIKTGPFRKISLKGFEWMEVYEAELESSSRIATVRLIASNSAEPWSASTYVKATEVSNLKVPGETTELYKQINVMLQEESDRQKKEIAYQFTTTFPKLAIWAHRQGAEIFGWGDSLSPLPSNIDDLADANVDLDQPVTASVTYQPRLS